MTTTRESRGEADAASDLEQASGRYVVVASAHPDRLALKRRRSPLNEAAEALLGGEETSQRRAHSVAS